MRYTWTHQSEMRLSETGAFCETGRSQSRGIVSHALVLQSYRYLGR